SLLRRSRSLRIVVLPARSSLPAEVERLLRKVVLHNASQLREIYCHGWKEFASGTQQPRMPASMQSLIKHCRNLRVLHMQAGEPELLALPPTLETVCH